MRSERWTVEVKTTGRGDLACLLKDGKPIWITSTGPKRNFSEAFASAARVGAAFAAVAETEGREG